MNGGGGVQLWPGRREYSSDDALIYRKCQHAWRRRNVLMGNPVGMIERPAGRSVLKLYF
jgi:hypothetical protein